MQWFAAPFWCCLQVWRTVRATRRPTAPQATGVHDAAQGLQACRTGRRHVAAADSATLQKPPLGTRRLEECASLIVNLIKRMQLFDQEQIQLLYLLSVISWSWRLACIRFTGESARISNRRGVAE
jgi:hypothetical protein